MDKQLRWLEKLTTKTKIKPQHVHGTVITNQFYIWPNLHLLLSVVFAAFAPFAANIIHSNRTQTKLILNMSNKTWKLAHSFPNKPKASLKRNPVLAVLFHLSGLRRRKETVFAGFNPFPPVSANQDLYRFYSV